MDSSIVGQYRDTPVLVLGASGFIGRHVTRCLVETGADVQVAVRHPESMDGENLPRAPLQIDLLDFKAVKELVGLVSPSVIFSLAGYGIDPREKNEEKAQLINADLPPLLLESLLPDGRAGWSGQRLVHTGSALEYGACGGDLAESSPSAPTTPYGKTKLAGTEALQNASLASGRASVIARLFSVYGPGEQAGRLLPSLLRAARTAETLELTDGMQKRDFTYVEEVAEGLLRLGAAQPFQGSIVNLATGVLSTVRHFVETAADILGIPGNHLNFGSLPTRQEEMEHNPVSTRKLKALISWAPSVSVSQGIMRVCGLTE